MIFEAGIKVWHVNLLLFRLVAAVVLHIIIIFFPFSFFDTFSFAKNQILIMNATKQDPKPFKFSFEDAKKGILKE